MAIWNSVSGVRDGEDVSAETFNRPLGELAARTDYLRDLVSQARSDESALKVRVELSENDTPSVGDVVCIDPSTKKWIKASASTLLSDPFSASDRAFAMGLLTFRNGLGGIVVTSGKVDLSEFNLGSMVEGGESSFATGWYYLSYVPGKITRNPSGPKIEVGFFARNTQAGASDHCGDFAFVMPSHEGIGGHTHRTFTLSARPCGEGFVSLLSTDEPDSEGVVDVIGYPPEGGAEDGLVPRLEVRGDWTSPEYEQYEVELYGQSEDSVPLSWPCNARWRVAGETEWTYGGQLEYFGDEVSIGDKGMAVRIMPSPGQSRNTPYAQDSSGRRRWVLSREQGRGWLRASMDLIVKLPSGCSYLIEGPFPDWNSEVRFFVPKFVFNATNAELAAGDKVIVDGVEFTISGEDGNIPYAGTAKETWIQLASVCDKVFYDLDTLDVFIGAESVSVVSGEDTNVLSPVANNSEMPFYAVVVDGNGCSYANPLAIGGSTMVPVLQIPADRELTPLNHGLSIAMVSDVGPAVGDDATVTAHGVPGAVFRYNVGFDPDLSLHYPPVPLQSASLMLNGIEVSPLCQFQKAVVHFAVDSLYWMDDTAGRQPWPYPAMSHNDPAPAEDEYQEILHFVSAFKSETGPVTSLRAASGSAVSVTRCGTGETASVGDLEVGIDLKMAVEDGNARGCNVVKTARGGRLILGPVVEKLVAGPGITFSGGGDSPDGQGTFTISADGASYSGDFETVSLENAKLDSVGMFPYIRLLRWTPGSSTNVDSGFVAKFHVPATVSSAVYRVKFYATVFGETSFTGSSQQVAGVSMDYSILPDFNSVDGSHELETANLKTGLIRPDIPFRLNIPFGASDGGSEYSYDAYDPILIHNDSTLVDIPGKCAKVVDRSFPYLDDCTNYNSWLASRGKSITGAFGIRPGYTVAIRFSRADPSGAGVSPYTGAIGVLNLRWTVEEVATVDTSAESNIDDLVVETVKGLRKVASGVHPMDNSVEVVAVLTRLLNALK